MRREIDAWRELADSAGIAPRLARTRTLCELRAAAAVAKRRRRRRAVLLAAAGLAAMLCLAALAA